MIHSAKVGHDTKQYSLVKIMLGRDEIAIRTMPSCFVVINVDVFEHHSAHYFTVHN